MSRGHLRPVLQFRYSDLTLSGAALEKEPTASVPVTNTGTATGREVVQLYVTSPGKVAPKPVLELRGFAKTKTLKPGESETMSLTLTPRDSTSVGPAR